MTQFGGGYVASQGGYGNSSQTQFSQMSEKKRLDFLLPITAVMLRNAEERESRLFINDKEVPLVMFVGKITKCEVSETKLDCTVQDCSGDIQVTKWTDENQGQPDVYPDGVFVKVYGKPSVFNGQPRVNVYKMMKCQSYDEVTHHYMSVIYADLYAKKRQTDVINDPVQTAARTASTAEGTSFMGNDNNDEALSPGQKEILSLILAHQEKNENGVNINWLAQQLKRNIEEDLRYLMNEGQIYDTVNEEWVKTT